MLLSITKKAVVIVTVLQFQLLSQQPIDHVFALSRSVKENAALIKKAFTSDFVIPEFGRFTDMIDEMYSSCKRNTNGKVSPLVIV